MMNTSDQDADLWRMPRLDNEAAREETVAETAQGYAAGFAQGKEEGLAAARAEAEELRRQAHDVFTAIDQAVARFDDQLLLELADLVTTVASQLVRTELQLSPELIVTILEKLIAELQSTSGEIRIHLNSDDWQYLTGEDEKLADSRWTLNQDASLQRGDCVIESGDSLLRMEFQTYADLIIKSTLEEAGILPRAES